jgi:Spy/CpxP family protein refolding chaperone
MKLRYRQYIAATMVLALSIGLPVTYTFIQPALAQDIGEAPGKVLQQLNLSNDQIQQIKAIRSRNNLEIRSSRQRLRQLQDEMQSLMSGTSSSEQIRAKFNELQSARQQASKLQFEQMLAMREVLTPQQRSQLAQLVKQRKDNRRERTRNRG